MERKTVKFTNAEDLVNDHSKLQRVIDFIAKKNGFWHNITRHRCIKADESKQLFTVDIIDKKTERELCLFIKNKAGERKNKKIDEHADNYEYFVYYNLFLIYDKLQEHFNIRERDVFKRVKAYRTNSRDFIALDNLIKHGYKFPDNKKTNTLEYAQAALTELAKFHSLSFAVQKYKPNYFEKNVESLDFYWTIEKQHMEFIRQNMKIDLEIFREEKRDKVEDLVPTLGASYIDYFSVRSATLGLCHNNFKPGSTLIKELNGKIVDIATIDYKYISYGNIINDFMIFIFCSTDREFRRIHLNSTKSYYHQEFTKYLNLYNIDVNDVYPYHVFEKEFQERLQFGLLSGFIYLPLSLGPKDRDVQETSKGCLNVTKLRSEIYIKRINDLVEDFVDRGVL